MYARGLRRCADVPADKALYMSLFRAAVIASAIVCDWLSIKLWDGQLHETTTA